MNTSANQKPGLLGDTTGRDYARKLTLFNAFAEPEISALISALPLRIGMSVLDAGCGTGDILARFSERVGPAGLVVGIDLADAHVQAARKRPGNCGIVQADVSRPPLAGESFDLVWCANTIHHLHDPHAALQALRQLLKPSGQIVLAQSSLLTDMTLAWDSRLEQAVANAVRRHYQLRYGIPASRLSGVRALLGLARHAQLRDVSVRTLLIERSAPLSAADREYFTEVLFRCTWDQRLQPHMDANDYATLQALCDPQSSGFMLNRSDFHFLQTLTVVAGCP